MAEELAAKKALRRGHRSSTTRTLGQVDVAISSKPLDISKISQLKRSLEDKLRCLSTLDEEILLLTPEDTIEEEVITADEYKERIYIALSKLGQVDSASVRIDAGPRGSSTPPVTSRS